MSELIDNSKKRKDLLKHMILQLHKGQAPDRVKKQLEKMLGQIPYGEVVEVEQELISEGLPEKEVLKLCDVHTAALKGVIDPSTAKETPPGHPVHTFIQENRALQLQVASISKLFDKIKPDLSRDTLHSIFLDIQNHLNSLSDVEKHYRRKENLLFPFLEKHEITGPPTVMWGKHDEARERLQAANKVVRESNEMDAEQAKTVIDLVIKPALESIEEMIYKEEQILFPMCLDTLSDIEWYDIYKQSSDIGYCLYDPTEKWKPEDIQEDEKLTTGDGRIQLHSGGFSLQELEVILNTLSFDITFVDKEDKVSYFSQGTERIFDRSRAILGRKVQHCHPPSSVHIVEQILDDFKAGRQDHAPFWINLHGRFIHIEYFALHDKKGEYIGTLEVSQDLTHKRALEGEQRILNYESGKNNE
jgi:hypothetical protein